VAAKRDLPVGALCEIVSRGKTAVFATEFYGSYFNGSDFETRKTTSEVIVSINAERADVRPMTAFPFLRSSSVPLEKGTLVVVVHEPVEIDHSAVRKHMGTRSGSSVCEILVPSDGKTRWVRSGCLRRVR
jgi:hypothetical protein